jgi:hypothetical protein
VRFLWRRQKREILSPTADSRSRSSSAGRDEHVKIVLAGHSGTGKSTELTKFCAEQQSVFHPVVFSIRREATLSNVTLEQLLILIVETVLGSATDYQDEISTDTIDAVHAWFSEVFEKYETHRRHDIATGAEAKAKGSSLGLLELGAWLKADMRAGAQVIHTTITKENRRRAELAHRCGGPLADLPCKAIYTFPVFMQCSPRMQSLDPRFHLTTLPMIKVRNVDYSRDEVGFATMREILGRRMDLSLISDDALDLAIDLTGGVPRDLFDVMISAASVARQAFASGARDTEKIEREDVRYGLNRRKARLLTSISVEGLPEVYRTITVDQLFARLREYGTGAHKNPPSDPTNLALMQAHALIEYNGERWFRVHPLVSEHVQSLIP